MDSNQAMCRHFERLKAVENEETGKSHFPVPLQKRPREGRFGISNLIRRGTDSQEILRLE